MMNDRDAVSGLAARGTPRGAAAVEAGAKAANRRRRRRTRATGALAAIGLLVTAGVVLANGDGPDVVVAPPTSAALSASSTAPPPDLVASQPEIFEIPFAVNALGEGFGSLWVVGGAIDTEESGGQGHVLRIDPETGDVLEDIRVTGEPIDVDFSSSSVWVRTVGWMSIPPNVVEISPHGTHGPIETPTAKDGGLAASERGVWFLDGAGSVEYAGDDDGGYRGAVSGGEIAPALFVSARDDVAVLTSPYNGVVFVANVRGGGEQIADLGVPLADSLIVGDAVWIRGQDSMIYVVGIADGELLQTIDVGARTTALLAVDAGLLALAADGRAFLIDPGSGAFEELPGWSAAAVATGTESDVVWSVAKNSPTTVIRGRVR